MIPPSVLVMKIGRGKRRIVIPLFLLWPVVILLAPVVLIICAVCAACTGRIKCLTAPLKFYKLVCALRGLHVDVKDREDSVLISVR